MKYISYSYIFLVCLFFNVRSSDLVLTVESKSRFKQDVRMDKELYVHEKAYFDDDVQCKDNVKIKKDLFVKGGILVEGDLSTHDIIIVNASIANVSVTDALITNSHSVLNQTVEETLSAADVVVGCELTVDGNLNLNTFTELKSMGVISKEGQTFIHDLGTVPFNTFIGLGAGSSITTGLSNTGVGFASLQQNTNGGDNTAIGATSLNANTFGTKNTAIGALALSKNVGGTENTAIGYGAFALNQMGSNNTVCGSEAFPKAVGSSNVIIGGRACFNTTDASKNVIIGYEAGSELLTGDNNIFIGKGVSEIGSASNITRIGNTQKATLVAGIFSTAIVDASAVYIDANKKLGTIPSSRRFKHNIKQVNNESACIYDLDPLVFVYKHDDAGIKQYGLIAEDVAQIIPELVINDKDGAPLTVRYEILPVLLLNEIKKRQLIIDNLNNKIEKAENLKNQIEQVESLKETFELMSALYTRIKKQVEESLACD